MSVEADEMRYYAELDREQARDEWIERDAADRAEEIQSDVYDWLTARFGENVAIALYPGEPGTDTYGDADTLESIKDGRKHFAAWLAAESERAAIAALED